MKLIKKFCDLFYAEVGPNIIVSCVRLLPSQIYYERLTPSTWFNWFDLVPHTDQSWDY